MGSLVKPGGNLNRGSDCEAVGQAAGRGREEFSILYVLHVGEKTVVLWMSGFSISFKIATKE